MTAAKRGPLANVTAGRGSRGRGVCARELLQATHRARARQRRHPAHGQAAPRAQRRDAGVVWTVRIGGRGGGRRRKAGAGDDRGSVAADTHAQGSGWPPAPRNWAQASSWWTTLQPQCGRRYGCVQCRGKEEEGGVHVPQQRGWRWGCGCGCAGRAPRVPSVPRTFSTNTPAEGELSTWMPHATTMFRAPSPQPTRCAEKP